MMRLGSLLVVMMIELSCNVMAQVKDLTQFDSAKNRLDQYLIEADAIMDSRGLLFRLSQADSEESGLLELSEVAGIQFADAKKKVQYSCNQRSSPDTGMPQRSESLRFDGKLRAKMYLVNTEKSGGRSFDIERDLSKTDEESRHQSQLFGPMVEHMIIDPFGLPLRNVSEIRGTLSSVENTIRNWIVGWDFVDQESADGRLKSRWISADKNYMSELVFDDRQGGMPVLMRSFGVDQKRKEKKDYIAETRTAWAPTTDGDDKWIPQKIRMTDSDNGGSRTLSFEFDFIEKDTFERILNVVEWKELFEGNNPKWHMTITNEIQTLTKRKR